MFRRKTDVPAGDLPPATEVFGSNAWLIAFANDTNLRMSSVTYDANDIIATANVTWPDGTSGVWTTTGATADGPTGATVTYVGSSTKTVTLAWTYDGSGRQTTETRVVS